MWCEKRRKVRLSGTLTVEMAYLLPVLLTVFQMVIYSVFYYHDKNILLGAAGETVVTAAQYERKAGAQGTVNLEAFFQNQIDGKLILFSKVTVETAQTDDEIEITASAQKGYMRVEVLQRAVISKPEKSLRRMQILQKWMTDEGKTE